MRKITVDAATLCSKITSAERATSAIWARHSTASNRGDLAAAPTPGPSRPGWQNSQPPRVKARKSRQQQSFAALSLWSHQRSFAIRPPAPRAGASAYEAVFLRRAAIFEVGYFQPAPADCSRPWSPAWGAIDVRAVRPGVCGRRRDRAQDRAIDPAPPLVEIEVHQPGTRVGQMFA
jgi:hypothetical protein